MWIWCGTDGVNIPTSFRNSMELYTIRRNPIYLRFRIMEYCYGANPYHSQSTLYRKCMELYKMSSNPIAIDNRMATKKKQ